MELLFTEEEFSAEFKKALGFVDSDIKWQKIKPDLLVATRNLVEDIGLPTYQEIVANNKKSNEERDTTLEQFSKNAIAISSYVLHAPINNLAHTPNGRRMRSSEDEKTPFEWMIKDNDDTLQKRSFRSIDTLIKYMDESFEPWKASEVYIKSFNSYIRNLAEFNPFYVLESRYLLLKLTAAFNRFEKKNIIPRISKSLNDLLKAYRLNEGENEEYDELIALIQEATAYYSLSWALPRLQLNLFPDGVLQPFRGDRNTINARKVPEGMQIDQVSQLFKQDYLEALKEIENLVKEPEEIIEETNDASIYFGFEEGDGCVNT